MRVFEFDEFQFDPADGRLAARSGSSETHLRPQAGKLLVRLLEHPRTVVDRASLINEIWGEQTVVDFESGLAALLREIRQAIQSLGGDPALVETVPRRGYRLRADVSHADHAEPRAVRRTGRRWRTGAVIACAAVLVAALVATAWWRSGSTPADARDRAHQLAILPLERFGDPDYPPARAGILLADGILAALWRAELENLELIGRAGMRPFAERDDVVSAVAAELGVNLLIEGAIRIASDGWQVDIRLMEVPPGRVVWSHTVAGRAPALPTGEIADEFVHALGKAWPDVLKLLNQM